MNYSLRWYQKEANDAVFQYFAEGGTGNPVVCAPTGSGKSIVIADFVMKVLRWWPSQRILVLTHRKKLVEQNVEKLASLWPELNIGVNNAELKRREYHQHVIFGTINSVVKNAKKFGRINLVLIDEAHLVSHTSTTMYRRFINELMIVNPNLKVIGYTATPWRMGHGRIVDPTKDRFGREVPSLFTDIVYDCTDTESFNRMIREGVLSPIIPASPDTYIDVDDVRIDSKTGDYNMRQLQMATDKFELTEGAVREAIRLAWDRKHWLVFASGIDHVKHVCESLNRHGVDAVMIHSRQTNQENEKAIEKFTSGKVRALVNADILTTGFDYPSIDCILMLRATMSIVLWRQMLGRGTRVDGKKLNCLVLDFANNTHRLGEINHNYVPPPKGSKKGGPPPMKKCPKCMGPVFASVMQCNNKVFDGVLTDKFDTRQGVTECDYEFPQLAKFGTEASTDALIKDDAPLIQNLKVDYISISKHMKPGRPSTLKVSYLCGLRSVTEYIAFEHGPEQGSGGQWARRRAEDWWRKRSNAPVPSTVDDALHSAGTLLAPTHIRVVINKRYPEILAVCFDGTNFGQQEASGVLPSVDIAKIASTFSF